MVDALAAHLDAAFGDFAALGFEQVRDRAQGGGFAGAVAAQEGGDLAVGHLQRDALEHQDDVVVNDLDAVDVDDDGGGAHG